MKRKIFAQFWCQVGFEINNSSTILFAAVEKNSCLNILVKFEGRTVMADNVFEEVSEIDAWLQTKTNCEQNFPKSSRRISKQIQ